MLCLFLFFDNLPKVPHVHESLKEKEDQKGQLTLADCLRQFLTQEKLSAEDPWYCPKCKVFVRATKKFDLWRLPELLVIHLKRFSFSRIWYVIFIKLYHLRLILTHTRRNKLSSFVDFPLEELDLSNYTSTEQDIMPIYDLYAVSVRIVSCAPIQFLRCNLAFFFIPSFKFF